MGGSASKRSRKNRAKIMGEKVNSNLAPSENEVRVVSQSTYDEEAVKNLKKELADNPEVFVLNNLLMSFMFFENYEREKQKLIHSTRTAMEKELNPILLKNETIECITPDVIFEKVNKNIRFRPLHGPSKFKAEPLVPKRLFVVNDNIEVVESADVPHYSAIDKPSYQVRVEDSKRSGFVKLRRVDLYTKQTSKSAESQSEDGSDPEPGPSTSTADNDASSESTYGYSTITQMKTPQLLNIVSGQRRDTLPKTCFTVRKIKRFDEHSSDSESDEDLDEEPIEKIEAELYEEVTYISSKGFMTYFQNAVFPNSLGKTLGFDLHEISLAKAIPGTIFCNLMDDESNLVPCEILPSVAIPHPSNQTFEFLLRDSRPTLIDKAGNRYRWPTDEMIKDLRSFSCVLLPKGYFMKRGENVDSEIEWEIGFPKSEKYLDTRMSHAQIRSMLYLLTLFKTYIEPETKQHGLLVDHIRHHMYWECEANFRDWPEHRMGTKLLMVIENLCDRLAKSHLSDFFIKQKNVFENIPNKYLKYAQKQLHNILESPIIYFIGALRNLRYTSGKFYPPLNFKKLHSILTTEGIQSVHSSLIDDSSRPPNYRKKKRQQNSESDVNFRKELGWRQKQERLNREKILKKRQEEKEKKENLNIQRKGSIDSINFSWECEKQFDIFKRRELLIFFTKHFIEIGKRSRKLSTERQSLLYLKQAYYLAKILGETPGLREDSIELLDIIAKEEEASKKMAASEPFDSLPPSTPKRNSAQFNFDLTQQVKGNNINLNNLNKTFTSATPGSTTTFKNVKRQPSNLKSKRNLLSTTNVDVIGRKSVGFSESVEMR